MNVTQANRIWYEVESLQKAINNEVYAGKFLTGGAAIDSMVDIAWLSETRKQLRLKVKPKAKPKFPPGGADIR